ncbi:MAG: metal-dependent hydrolase [Chloroflexota bacterium]
MKDDAVTIAYFGAAAFKVTTARGKKILIDPYITRNPMCRQKLDFFYDVDVILVTHGAHDHLGDSVAIMKGSKAVLVCGRDVAAFAIDKGIPGERIQGTVYGDEKDFDGVRVKTVNAIHNSRIDTATKSYIGMAMGYVLTLENGIRIYHAGDTAIFGDLKLAGMLYRPNVLLVGISGVTATSVIEMNYREAALATLWIGPDIVVPMHYPPESDEARKFGEAVKVVAPNVEPAIMEPNSQITYSKYAVVAGSL